MTDHTELKTAIEYILNQGALEREFIEDADALDAAWAVYEALGPTDILALIADIEDARNGMKHSCAIRLKKEIERLKAELDCPFRLARHSKRLVEQLRAQAEQYDQALIKMAAERDQLKSENEALREEVALDDKLIADRDRLLNMFECPVHGQCIPYAMDQVEALRKDADRLHSAATFVQKLCDSAGTQPSVATGYLHDILSALGSGEQS